VGAGEHAIRRLRAHPGHLRRSSLRCVVPVDPLDRLELLRQPVHAQRESLA
jgi:hypothetical protein